MISSEAQVRDEVVIDAEHPPSGIAWSDLWRHRELLYFLTWRDVKVRYKQTAIGVVWALLQPLASVMVYWLFFGRFAGLEAKTPVSYPVYVLAGQVLWTFFQSSVTNSAGSLVSNSSLVTRVYFPRIIIPLSAAGAALVDLAITTLLVLLAALTVGAVPGVRFLLAPAAVVLSALAALGVGSALAALTVRFRDFQYAVPFLLQIWFFLTPVLFPAEMLPAQVRTMLALNPMAGAISLFRTALLNTEIQPLSIGISFAVAISLFAAGGMLFSKVERQFADVI